MSTDMVRLNIAIPKETADALNRAAGPRKRSQFIVEAVRQKIRQKEKEDLDRLLSEGYRASLKESRDIAEEFETLDLEGWDEY
ncbi:MAG: hypothetical protein V3S89_09200 [Desulfobacterales bacterium]